jgi:hypothetical protein
MGKVFISIAIRGVGFQTGARATGRITLSNASGTVVVDLTGPVQPSLSPIPSNYHYKVVGGTGAYANLKDEGQLTLTRIPDAIPVRSGIRYIETGTFRLTI